MNVIILGASGFIGKNLNQKLSEDFGVKNVSLRNENWKNQLSDAEVLINLVGKAHDHKGTATESDFLYANLELTKQIFDTFKKTDSKVLIHISSLAALEGTESNKALVETDDTNPQSFYGKSKREAEKWLLEQELSINKKIIILRPPMVHGPGDKGNLGLLYKLVSKGIPYPLAAFNNKRSFISIDNFSYFIQEILNKYSDLDSGIYHIADDEAISTSCIIDIIKNVENKSVPNLSLPKPFVKLLAKVGDVVPFPLNSIRLKKMTSDLIVSNQKIKTVLGISKLPLTAEEGIVKTIKSFKNK